MRKIGLMLTLVMIFFLGCKSESDVLATYTNGKVTRGDLYRLMKTRSMKKEQILTRKSQQKRLIQQIAVQNFLYEEALKALPGNPEFKEIHDIVKKNTLARFAFKKVQDGGKFNEDISRVKIIKLMVKNYKIENNKRVNFSKQEVDVETKKVIEEAKKIIADLDKAKGSNYDELVKKHSTDFSKRKNGDIGYIVKGTRGKAFSDAAFGLKKGEYTKEPVSVGNNVYIIKCEDRQIVNESNIDSVLDDKKTASQFKKRLAMNSARNYPDTLAAKYNAKLMVENIGKNPEALLFKIGNTEYKVKEFTSFKNLLEKKRKEMNQKFSYDAKGLERLADSIFKMSLLVEEAQKLGLDKDKEFIESWKEALSSTYRNEIMLADMTVSDKDVIEEYNKNKDTRYTKKKNEGKGKNKNVIKTVMPLDEKLKSGIKRSLLQRKKNTARTKIENDLLKKHNFQIIEKKLEGK